ncbi:ATP-binding cassette domain-containing protein [Pandoraea bronchicola]|uniref:ATP-binding cassette domain-containing protein n=1 Tax=Pandoraea bronchicola TaxID=2508287 RepID=UPI0015840390|nr:ATP-binding cassette domain-containing protein [Pandoraea bronchicola]
MAQMLGVSATQATWLWLFLVLMALRVLVGLIHGGLTTWLSKQVHRHLSEKTFRRVLYDEPIAEIYRRSIGYYITLAGDDTFRAGMLVNSAFQSLGGLMSAMAGFLLLYLFSHPLFWGTMGFLFVCALIIAWTFRMLMHANQQSVELSREAGTAYVEALNSLRSIRSMGSEGFVLHSYVDQIRRYVQLLCTVEVGKQCLKVLPALLLLCVGIVVVWPGASLSMGLTTSYFFAATTLLIRVFMSLGVMMTSGSTLIIDVRAAKDIHELTGDPQPHANAALPHHERALSRLEFRDVGFSYHPGKPILDRLTCRFEIGKVYAITGRSGSGKSTLADMLLGLIEPQKGQIIIDGSPAHAQQLRDHVVLVEQQARIFSASVRENLLLGMKCDDSRIWRALRAVDLEQHVQGLPAGLNTPMTYQGANFSGGQRQRLGIARAILREPNVLILDEATSALDERTREAVLAGLHDCMKGKGILVFITHEQEVAELADVVINLTPVLASADATT